MSSGGEHISNIHQGSTLDACLHEAEIYEEATSIATARVLAWQIKQQMQEQGLTKQAMAVRMGTSGSQLDRLLNPGSNGITLETMHRAARAVNRQLRVELV